MLGLASPINRFEAGRKPASKLAGFHLHNAGHKQTINGRKFTLKDPYYDISGFVMPPALTLIKKTRSKETNRFAAKTASVEGGHKMMQKNC